MANRQELTVSTDIGLRKMDQQRKMPKENIIVL